MGRERVLLVFNRMNAFLSMVYALIRLLCWNCLALDLDCCYALVYML